MDIVASSQLALLASLTSVVLTVVLLAPRRRAYGIAVACGLVFGAGVWLIAREASTAGAADWWWPAGVCGLLALGLAVLLDWLLGLRLPVISRVRPLARRALRPQSWGTPAEISEASGVDAGIIAVLGVGIEARPITFDQLLLRARIAAYVAASSVIFLLLAFKAFRTQVLGALNAGSLLLNALATLFVVFFLGPAQDLLVQSVNGGGAVEPSRARGGPVVLAQALVTFLVLVIVQALQSAVQSRVGEMTLTEWVIVLELCVLPVLVTTYYFGAALFRDELGERRWERALEATLVAGAIVFLPITLYEVFPHLLPPQLVASILDRVLAPRSGTTGLVLLGLLLTYASLLLALAAAVAASAATYGVYGLALAIAMTEATAATARRRVFTWLVVAGVVAQGLTIVWAWLAEVSVSGLSVVHLLLAVGWGVGLVLSGFHQQMPAQAVLREP
ncbi:MAG: hypothetical protein IT182_12065 [Acidobacteria bacterium]|nr:hypothetical protein [Acidobacteriota bacterium]